MAAAASQSTFQKFLNSPAGPKTIHFWAPAMIWVSVLHLLMDQTSCAYLISIQALVIAGISDLQRPAEKLSLPQTACKLNGCCVSVLSRVYFLTCYALQIALLATGLIWTRYSMVIIPKNYSLGTVNLFVAGTSLVQLGRIFQ